MALSIHDHDRDSAGMTYVYPVISRRARGLSIGINLNPNNACNFRCIYCQVPGLTRGKAPRIDLGLLERELRELLDSVVNGDFLAREAPPGSRRLNDIAFSGNGEPTSAVELEAVARRVGTLLEEFELVGKIKVVVITNGSLIHREEVRAALETLRPLGGEVWFKLDSATAEGQAAINGNTAGMERTHRNLALSCELCPTWLQTCVFAVDGEPPAEREQLAYLELLDRVRERGIPLRGIQLYGLARPSCQPEAETLSPLPPEWLEAWAERIRERGFVVVVSG